MEGEDTANTVCLIKSPLIQLMTNRRSGSAAEEPTVCRLNAGGGQIRTIGSAAGASDVLRHLEARQPGPDRPPEVVDSEPFDRAADARAGS